MNKLTILKDSREQSRGHGWTFQNSDWCQGTIVQCLKTGDYTIEGIPANYFVIERKYGTAELASNITQKRFEDELKRLEEFVHPFIVVQCDIYDIFNFPDNSGIPKTKWSDLRITSDYMLKRLMEYQIQYKTKIIFGGFRAKDIVISLFKRIRDSLI